MQPIYLLAIVVIVAYALQITLGLRQLKDFNRVYSELRRQGKVAIGRRSGKIKAGTIVMFALDDQGTVLDAKKMQGVTVLARFKSLPAYIGQDIHYLDGYNPLVRQENRLLQIAIEDARELFLRTQAGNYQEVPKLAPLTSLGTQLALLPHYFRLKLKK